MKDLTSIRPRGESWSYFCVFLSTFLVLFLCMNRYPNVYDESLILTGAMRVAAGEVPHRDFYANYGPAQFYVLAGLFKLFGKSVLVARLFDLTIKAMLVTLIYHVISAVGPRSVAVGTCAVAVLWLQGVNVLNVTPVIPVSLLCVAGSVVLLPLFEGRFNAGRMFVAGIIAGVATLFRYDVGAGLFIAQIGVIAIAVYLGGDSGRGWIRRVVSALKPNVVGYAVIALLLGLIYASAGVGRGFFHDILLYPSKYYRRGRSLPFPGVSLSEGDNLIVYLIPVIVCLSLWIAATRLRRSRDESSLGRKNGVDPLVAFLITFGVLSLTMYVKGLVRISVGHMYLAIVPSLMLLAVLFQNRLSFSQPLRILIAGLFFLFVGAGIFALRDPKMLADVRYSISNAALRRVLGRETAWEKEWCQQKNAATRGICFASDRWREQTIAYVDSHTEPSQKIFVGVTRHDRVYANDNFVYFAAQRLPATRWSHFDPGLQNREDIQREMVRELDASRAPYAILDLEFDGIREPNDSSRSSGVTILDDYLGRSYRQVENFGEMSIWQRANPQAMLAVSPSNTR